MLAFWSEALRYVPREPPSPGWCVLRDPEGRGPNVSLNGVPTKRSSRSRLHIDLYTSDRDTECSGSSLSARLAIRGGIARATTSSSLRIPTVTCFAWWRNQRGRTNEASSNGWLPCLLAAGILTAIVDGLFSSLLSAVFYGSTVQRLFQRALRRPRPGRAERRHANGTDWCSDARRRGVRLVCGFSRAVLELAVDP